jgi:spore germination protein GerM
MPWALIFWAAFFVVIFGLFLINREQIRKTLKDTQFIERLLNKPVADTAAQPLLPLPGDDISTVAENPPAETKPNKVEPPPASPKQEPAKPEAPAAPAPKTETAPSSTPAAQPQPAKPPADQPQPAKPPAAQPASRDRALYFTQIDSDGAILRVKTTRSLAVSDSPLVDALGALISGPDAREKRQGMVSLIPQGTRILNATVRGSTAYISFSEEFQYNTYGVEGYAAALKQIVWTATEFSNVRDVQILIEGRRVDYLGEGIWIGSPVSREMLN